VEEAALAGVVRENGGLDGEWSLEPVQGLEGEGALSVVLLAVGLLLGG
jgi:hypothetical protein